MDVTGRDPLRDASAVLAVVAHPDDESFGLGAILDRVIRSGARAGVLCFTHGEASTLHGVDGDLRTVRAVEMDRAAAVLGVRRTLLLDYRDGALAPVPLAELAGRVGEAIERLRPSHLLAFDDNGVTGHPDHVRATEAAVAAAERYDLPVLAWALPVEVARALNARLGTAFAGRTPAEIDATVPVSRRVQAMAIACHRSQAVDNPVLRLRLSLQGDTECLRRLR